MTTHRYPAATIYADYVRSALGAAITLGPIIVFDALPVMVYILGGLGALFLAFGLRTFLRQMSYVEVSPEAICLRGPRGSVLQWRKIDAVSLKYFTTRRDKEGGWMQLGLTADGSAITVDSSIEGFGEIAELAWRQARQSDIPMESRTLANFRSLGFAGGEHDGAPMTDG